jgi:hypothetical protein
MPSPGADDVQVLRPDAERHGAARQALQDVALHADVVAAEARRAAAADGELEQVHGGEPMKPATNMLAGRSYMCRGGRTAAGCRP